MTAGRWQPASVGQRAGVWGSQVLAWTRDDRLLTQGGADHVVRVWQVGRAEPVREWAVSPWEVLFSRSA